MQDLPKPLTLLLLSWGFITALLAALTTYRAGLSRREDDSLYLHKAEQILLVGEQQALVVRMNRVARLITPLAVLSGALLLAVAGLWLWTGFSSF